MKKLKLVILSIVVISILFVLTGCTSSEAKTEKRFIEIYRGFNVVVYYDNQTKVQYASCMNGHGGTALTVLLDAEGKPLLYEGE